MLPVLIVLALCGLNLVHCQPTIEPFKSEFNMAAGAQLKVTCKANKAGATSPTWTHDGVDLQTGKDNRTTIQGSVVNGDNASILTISHLRTDDAGRYECKSDGRGEAFTLTVYQVEVKEVEYQHLVDVVLGCKVTDGQEYKYSWTKNGEAVSAIPVDGKQKFVDHENGTLEIQHPPRAFAGEYICTAESGDRKIEIPVQYYATPKVIPFDKSKNLVQDEPLVIECKVLGHPKPKVSWFKDGQMIKEGEGSRYKLAEADTYNGEVLADAKLSLESVDFDDGGVYVCMATTLEKWPQFNSTQEILVRVKDKLAALWPFLGIVAEVIILCTIIFIYEKKRNKDAADEEDANQDGATPEKKSEGVRHRGSANNPRA